MTKYTTILSTPLTQTQQAHSRQAPNNAGGYSFALDRWARLEQFLILGSTGGTYYVGARQLTGQNVDALRAALDYDPRRAVDMIADVSVKGRSFNNDAPLLCLAEAVRAGGVARKEALAVLPQVVRTGSHLLSFMALYEALKGGWGRSVRRGVSAWFADQAPDRVAYQVLKYQNREGWSQRDVLRLAHTKPGEDLRALLAYVVKGVVRAEAPALVHTYEAMKAAKGESAVVKLITDHRLPFELVPSQWHGSANVWRALLPHMPMTALMRNLGRLTKLDVLTPFDCKDVVRKLTDPALLKAARLHPLALLNAWKVYSSGKGVKGSLNWTPVPAISAALESAFTLSFGLVEPTGKRFFWAQDVSGSMTTYLAGNLQIDCMQAGAALATTFAKSEEQVHVMGFSDKMETLPITKNSSFAEAYRYLERMSFGRTDCAQPMLHAAEKRWPVDCFVVNTDSETYAGAIHPHVALERYRQKMGIDAKLIVMGMASNGFSIANPEDPGMLDVVGMDTQVFNLIRYFAGAAEVAEHE